jgi:UDP-N-acetylglucosamine--N-acetylmuramyl-(pentapeptide) pyrophosphoryl-undecaprenol N-acetylglucosamine transferase
MTVSELCAAGVASILVPLVVSTTSHQQDNARWMAAHGAAWHVPQPECTPEHLAGLLGSINRSTLVAMAGKARSLARPHATQALADMVESVLPSHFPWQKAKAAS